MYQSNEIGLSFYNCHEKRIQPNIWEELNNGLWKTLTPDNFFYNNTLNSFSLNKIKPLFKGFQQIIPGTQWNLLNNQLELDLYYPSYVTKCSFKDFIETAAKYFHSLKAHKIGVHLSGGLDSSLIIGLLHTLNIPFVPIGLKSNSFEFRTERKIQEILIEWGDEGLLLDMEEYPYYSQLTNIPSHQIPDDDIKSIAGAKALAKSFAERGCDIVLTGQGGDSLFVDDISEMKNISFNIGDEFLNTTEQDRIYGPMKIRLEAFYANKNIIDVICSARIGQKDDPLKKWARNWAKEILPKELSDFTYCADFFGQTIWGLHSAKPVIKDLMEETYYLTNSSLFSPKRITEYLNRDIFSFEYKEYNHLCSLISIACWYHSFFNNNN